MNQNYFNEWSPAMAYYLGWIWADGSTGSGKLQLGCVTEDEKLILDFLKIIGSDHKVIRRPGWVHKKGYNIAPYTQVSVYCRDLVSCLIEKHGMLPRKTYLDLRFPQIEPKYLPHFVRGYFDGDGSIFKTKNKVGISIVGTKDFMKHMQQAICSACGIPAKPLANNKNTMSPNASWYIAWDKKAEVLTFLNFIYTSDGPRLLRKEKLADVWSEELRAWCHKCGISSRGGRIRLRFLNQRLGEYATIEECRFARNHVHLCKEGYPYPVQNKSLGNSKECQIKKFIEARLAGDKTHQRKLRAA